MPDIDSVRIPIVASDETGAAIGAVQAKLATLKGGRTLKAEEGSGSLTKIFQALIQLPNR